MQCPTTTRQDTHLPYLPLRLNVATIPQVFDAVCSVWSWLKMINYQHSMPPLLYCCQDAKPSPTQIRPWSAPPLPLLAICLVLSAAPFISFLSLTPSHLRYHNNFQSSPGKTDLLRHTRQSQAQRESTSHVPFDTSFPRDMTIHVHTAWALANREKRHVPGMLCAKWSLNPF